MKKRRGIQREEVRDKGLWRASLGGDDRIADIRNTTRRTRDGQSLSYKLEAWDVALQVAS